MSMTRRRLLDDTFKKTVEGNPAIATDSLARMYSGIVMQGWTEQAKTTGAQLFDASKLQTQSSGGATVTNNGDGSFTVSGSGNLSSVFNVQYDYSHDETIAFLQVGKEIKLNQTSPVSPTVVMQLRKNNANYKTVSTTGYTISEEDVQDQTFYIRLIIYGGSGSEIIPGTYKPMVYQDGDGTWEPYTGGKPSPSPDYPQEIVSAGKYNEDTQKWEYEVSVGGAQLIDTDQLTIGGINGGSGGNYDTQAGIRTDAYIPVDAKCTYTLSGYSPYKFANGIVYDESKTKIGFLSSNIQIPEGGKYIRLSFTKNDQSNFTDDELDALKTTIMLNPGSTALPYTPYRPPQTVTLTADRPLTKWDRLEKRNGQWGWVYKSNTHIFNGNTDEGWYRESDYVVSPLLRGKIVNDKEIYCDEFTDAHKNSATSPCIYASKSGAIVVKYTQYTNGDISAWNEYVASNPFVVWYETIEETFVPITAAEQEAMEALHTYRPTTVLSNQQDCDMTLTYKTRKGVGGG